MNNNEYYNNVYGTFWRDWRKAEPRALTPEMIDNAFKDFTPRGIEPDLQLVPRSYLKKRLEERKETEQC